MGPSLTALPLGRILLVLRQIAQKIVCRRAMRLSETERAELKVSVLSYC